MNNEVEKSQISASNEKAYILYKRRWYMLFVVVMFNISNAMIWITFAPVANYSASYFNITETKVNWFSLVFFIVFVPCCGLSWWILETRGFRFSVITGTSLNALGGAIRIAGVFFCDSPTSKFNVVLVGQILSACTQPLVLSMPTKIAALWFGDHERTIANTIASISNPVGVLLANGIAAGLVTKASDVKLMLVVFGVPAVIAALLAIFGFNSSKPQTPPSASALTKQVSFFLGIKEVMKNKQFLLLVFTSGCGIASFSFITSIMQQLICVKGYTDVIAGIGGAMVIVGGLIGSTISGLYIDRTRNYMETAKILILFMGVASSAIIIISNIRGQTVLLVFVFTLYGMFGLGGMPVFLELGVECTFPVDEATSSGMQWMVGQMFGAAMMMGGLGLAPQLTREEVNHSTCAVFGAAVDSHPVNLKFPLIAMMSFCLLPTLVFVGCFKTPYKRLFAEQEAANLQRKSSSGSNSGEDPCSAQSVVS